MGIVVGYGLDGGGGHKQELEFASEVKARQMRGWG
jgi:hypothetical protein